jgi:hypothetical protein
VVHLVRRVGQPQGAPASARLPAVVTSGSMPAILRRVRLAPTLQPPRQKTIGSRISAAMPRRSDTSGAGPKAATAARVNR